MTNKIYNFSAGPSKLPEAVVEIAKNELSNWHGKGFSIMEISHRGKDFGEVLAKSKQDLRNLLGISDNFEILFLQGGATQQFSQIPINMLGGRSADYVITGAWSEKSFNEAKKVSYYKNDPEHQIRLVASTQNSNFTKLPEISEIKLNPYAAYLHLCTNETIHGVEIDPNRLTPLPNVPLIADMSSHILSRPFDIEKFGLVYAGAQKNIGPAGLTLVIVRKDLLGLADLNTPKTWDYAQLAENDSMINTPPTFAIYMAGLVFDWLLNTCGGLENISKINKQKADLLYQNIDNSGDFYINSVQKDCRSQMNVPFIINKNVDKNGELLQKFLAEAEQNNLVGLKGHKSVGGLRASLYNAVTLEEVKVLCDFLQEFQRKFG